MKTIRYIPITDILMFITAWTLVITFYLNTRFHIAILVLCIVLAYTTTALGTNFITIKNRTLKLTYWYFIFWTETIPIERIIKITSRQTFEEDSGTGESAYYIFKRTYQIAYKDAKDELKNLHFKIRSAKKESEILSEIASKGKVLDAH